MVESQQRLESMRAAEARANSFLNPYSKGDHLDDVGDDGGSDDDVDDLNDGKESRKFLSQSFEGGWWALAFFLSPQFFLPIFLFLISLFLSLIS